MVRSLAVGSAVLLGAISSGSIAAAPNDKDLSAPASASAGASKLKAQPKLITEHAAFAPGSQNFLAVTFDITPKWHLYWPGQNDAGMAPMVELELPAGFSAGPVQWPAPKRDIVGDELINYIYEDELTLIIPITVTADAPAGEAVIKASLEWLVCEEACIPEESEVELRVPVLKNGDAPAPKSKDAPRFDAARKRHALAPDNLPRDVRVFTGEERGAIVAKGATGLVFYPHESGAVVVNALRTGESEGDQLSLRLEAPPGANEGEPLSLRGILEIRREAEPRVSWYQIDKPIAVSRRRENGKKDQ